MSKYSYEEMNILRDKLKEYNVNNHFDILTVNTVYGSCGEILSLFKPEVELRQECDNDKTGTKSYSCMITMYNNFDDKKYKWFTFYDNGDFMTQEYSGYRSKYFNIYLYNINDYYKEQYQKVYEKLSISEKQMVDFFLKSYDRAVEEGFIRDKRR